MAKILPSSSHSKFTTFFILSFFSFTLISAEDHQYGFAKTKLFGLNKEKLTHFRLFWHDILSGTNATSVQVVPPLANSSTAFGLMNMIDDPLTEGPELSSKMLGRAQGFYVAASQQEIGLLMAMNFAFIEALSIPQTHSTIIILYTETEAPCFATHSSTGVAITSSATKKGELFLADVNTQLKNKNITTDLKVDTASSLFTTITIDEPAPGLKTILSFKVPDQRSGKIELQYLHNYVGISTSVGLTANPVVNFSGVVGTDVLSLGTDLSFDSKSGTSQNAMLV